MSHTYCMHGEYNESCIVFRVPVCSSSTSSISQNCYPALQILCLFRLSTERSLRLCSQTRRPRFGMLYMFTVPVRDHRKAPVCHAFETQLWVVGMGLVALSRNLHFVSSLRPANTHANQNTLPDPFLQMQSYEQTLSQHTKRISKELLRVGWYYMMYYCRAP